MEAKRFVVEDRRTGQIVVAGTIDVDGDIRVVESSLQRDRINTIVEQIREDLVGGHNGGSITDAVEWYAL